MDSKSQLRQKFIVKRKAFDSAIAASKSAAMSRQILSTIDWTAIHSMHCFLPLSGDNEPDLRSVVMFALERGIEVFTSDPSSSTGRHVQMLQDAELQKRIKQYKLGDNQQFDLVIVPMVAYDPDTHHRLGFGGGFYDRLLAAQPTVKRLGVCFSDFTAKLPAEPHDIPIDEIIIA